MQDRALKNPERCEARQDNGLRHCTGERTMGIVPFELVQRMLYNQLQLLLYTRPTLVCCSAGIVSALDNRRVVR